MATLEILFSGLCAFVPRSDSATPELTVLLVNTASELCKKLSKPPEPHYPIFKFNLNNLKGGAPTAGVNGSARGLWLLDGEDVTFEIQGGTTGTAVKTGVSVTRGPGLVKGVTPNVPTTHDEEAFFDWVPNIGDVLPGEGNVSAKSITGIADNGPSVARVELQGGVLSTRKIGDFMGEYVIAQFVPYDEDPVTQALATIVAFQVDDLPEDFAVTFTATSFDGADQRSVTLSPTFDIDLNAGLVSVEISNLCGGVYIEDPDHVNRLRMVGDRRLAFVDEDFESFYIFCENFEAPPVPSGDPAKPFGDKYTRLPLPTFVKYPLDKQAAIAKADATDGGDTGGIDTVRCNAVQFSSYPKNQS